MTASVPNPGSPSTLAGLKYLGTASYTTPGTTNVPFPTGTKIVRFQLRGGGGGGGSVSGGVTGTGGGQGALQRRVVTANGTMATLVLGAGGAATTDGANSTFLGFSANGGKHGTNGAATPVGAGGLGADGAEVALGVGAYNGLSAVGYVGGANPQTTGTPSQGAAGTLGQGGNAGVSGGTVTGGKGGDGYCYLEFFG